ncbi:hypothetical protein ACEQ8H_001798 [Pleosporales sp. CAS-2024a]
MGGAPRTVAREVVELSSETSDESDFDEFVDYFDAYEEPQYPVAHLHADQNVNRVHRHLPARHLPVHDGADDVIDLTKIPDIDVPPSSAQSSLCSQDSGSENINKDDHLVTENVALQVVLDVLPNISVDHVLNIIKKETTDLTRTNAKCRDIINQLIDQGTYPKEDDDTKNKKRKRSEEEEWDEYHKAERDPNLTTYESDATELLKDEFLSVPVRHINSVIKEQKTLFKSYIVLEEQVRDYEHLGKRHFTKIGKARIARGAGNILIERGSQVPKELHFAKRKAESDMEKRRKTEEKEQAEATNRLQAQASGRMGECACCFDDVPLNRMIACNGAVTHLYCMVCPKRQIETQMGMSKCRPKCFGVNDCEGTFARSDLQRVLEEKTFERLEHLQQQEELAAAGLDFLSECPFCDFKMECLPIEVDKEFRCQNKKCGKTSCRLCEKETHIPLTCKEADKEGQMTLRHIVEEAMSAALIRQCNRCKHPFVKDHGCNKMTCSHCHNVQCYVCSKNVINYEHFGEAGQNRCPLHDNVEDRHEQEVKNAAEEAMAKVRADNPGLSDADLMVKVSDRVKEADDARKGRAQAQANAFPYHVVGGQLQALPHMDMAIPHIAQRLPPVVPYVPDHAPAVVPQPLMQPQQLQRLEFPLAYFGPQPVPHEAFAVQHFHPQQYPPLHFAPQHQNALGPAPQPYQD